VQGEIGDRRYDRWITFATGTPPPPVCLDATCPANTSAVETRVVDAAGAGVDASVEIVDLAAARHVAGREVRVWRPSGSGRFLPWTTVRVRAVHEDLEAITTRMLAPGVNEILLRLPGRVTAAR
jgi:hypothetical protein